MATKTKAAKKDAGDDINARKCITPVFRVSFPHLKEPQGLPGGEKKYSVVAIWPKATDLSVPASKKEDALSLKKIITRAIVQKWGDDKTKWPKNLKRPLRDGSEKEGFEGYEDSIFATLSNKKRPGLVGKDREPIEDIERDIYAGCFCRAEVIAAAYDQAGNKGVTLVLMNLQKVRDGEPLGGGSHSASEAFDDDLEDEEGSEDGEDEEESEDDDDLGI